MNPRRGRRASDSVPDEPADLSLPVLLFCAAYPTTQFFSGATGPLIMCEEMRGDEEGMLTGHAHEVSLRLSAVA